jgi:agmatine deiminase
MPKRIDFEDLRLPASYANLILNKCALTGSTISTSRVALNILAGFPTEKLSN